MSLLSLKAELETWVAALQAYDEEDFEKSLELFSQIGDSSKILTNMGLIYATLGEHEAAVERFTDATQLDQYLAVAYFQAGVSNFLLGNYDVAIADFDEALLYLRGNQAINYEQLGLKFLLYSAEILFNKGLCLVYLSRTAEGLSVMEEARQEKATDEHSVIDDAIQDKGEGYTVFSIPVGVLYRPSENKIKNAKTKDYMGKAKLVATSDANEAFTTFSGVTRLQQGVTPSGGYVDRPSDSSSSTVVGLGRSATMPSQPNNDGARLPRMKTVGSLPARPNSTVGPRTLTTPGGIGRSNTTLNTAKASPNAVIGGPVRALNVRRPGTSPNSPPVDRDRPALSPVKEQSPSATAIYDGYLDAYSEEPPPPLPSAGAGNNPDRVAAWAKLNANPNNAPQQQRVPKAPPSTYAPSSQGSRRRLTRRATARARPRDVSMYEEEEEGYGSGEYDDGPFELTKIRVKLHYQDDVRGMAITPEMHFDELVDRVTSKFGKSRNGLGLKFRDEDGGMVTLRDESDFELAIETARDSAKGKPEGKLDIWCVDV